MKKSKFNMAFDISDAVQAGIDDFSKLSGYTINRKENLKPIDINSSKANKQNHSRVILFCLFFIKLIK